MVADGMRRLPKVRSRCLCVVKTLAKKKQCFSAIRDYVVDIRRLSFCAHISASSLWNPGGFASSPKGGSGFFPFK
ncbi:hypothetical protein CEXT_676111 [Caerostris extrusa]|uniref:Uncharacterized protein n=1 Tax=Caerostris extrusa TaxID=172846 RepID=A0AAV4WPN2_CAEEX|nr:hypothetical protein CEXT_676111 [Caerostris extrusa]